MKSSILYLSLVCITCFSACTPHFYQPRPLEPVLLTGKNQFKVNAITDFNMGAISIAYCPKEHLGFEVGSGFNHNNSSGSVNNKDTVYLNEYYFNPYVSAGYYKTISRDILFEIYSGIGMYNYKNTAIAYVKNMQNIDLFIRPSIACVEKNINAAFTLRIDYFNRSKTTIADSVLSSNDLEKYKFLDYKNYLFAQPGITIKLGLKNFKFQFQISESIPFSGNYRSIYGYGFQPSLFNSFNDKNKLVYGFGVTVELNDLFKGKK